MHLWVPRTVLLVQRDIVLQRVAPIAQSVHVGITLCLVQRLVSLAALEHILLMKVLAHVCNAP